MALDSRIKAAAPSCYLTSLERLFATIGPQDAEQNIPGQVAFGLDHADYVTMLAPLLLHVRMLAIAQANHAVTPSGCHPASVTANGYARYVTRIFGPFEHCGLRVLPVPYAQRAIWSAPRDPAPIIAHCDIACPILIARYELGLTIRTFTAPYDYRSILARGRNPFTITA